MREVYATSRGEGLVAGVISEPSKIVLSLAVRDNEEQTEQFTLNAPTGRHDSREKGLGAIGSAGSAIVANVGICLSNAGQNPSPPNRCKRK